MTEFNRFDTKREDGVYVKFARIEMHDEDASPNDYLFQDEAYREQDQKRLDDWIADKWHFIGIRACAHIAVVRSGTGAMYTVYSSGLWGVESDSGEDYLEEVFAEQCEELKADIIAFGNAKFE